MSLAYGAFFGNVVLLPLWLQQYMGYTATLARAWCWRRSGVLAILLTPLVGRHDATGSIRACSRPSRSSIFALVLFMRSHFNTDADFGTLMVPTIIQGAAMAIFFIPLVTLSLSGLPPDRIPAASGLFNFARITAGSFGTSITTTLWDRRATLHHAQLVEHLTRRRSRYRRRRSRPAGQRPQRRTRATRCSTAWSTSRRSCCRRTTSSTSPALLFLGLIGVVWLARPLRGAAAAGRRRPARTDPGSAGT